MSISISTRHKILHTFFYGEVTGSRLFLAGTAFVWSILISLDPSYIDRPSVRYFFPYGNAYIWSAVSALVGLFQLQIVQRSWVNTPVTLVFDFIIAVFWCYSVVSYVAYDFPPPPTIATEMIVMIMSLWVFIRSGTEVKGDVVLGEPNGREG